MKFKVVVLFALCFGPFVALGQSKFVELETKFTKQTGFSARFTQTNYNKFKKTTTLLQGEVKWMRPGLARFEYTSPDPLLLVLGEKTVWIFDPLLENVTVESREEVQRIDELAFLFGSKKLSELYTALLSPAHQAKGQGGGWIYLKPKKFTAGLAELHLKPGGGLIQGFLIFDHQGNWRRFDLKEQNADKPPVLSDFVFEIPQGMEVIDKLRVSH